MTTATSSTAAFRVAVFDDVNNEKKSLAKYMSTVQDGQRLRGNNSLQCPGFTFEDEQEVFTELDYAGLTIQNNPVIRDGFYSVNNDKHLLYSDRSVFEIFNFSSTYVPTESALRHLCSYECDFEHVEVSLFERRNQDIVKHLYKRVSTFTLLPTQTQERHWPYYYTSYFDTSEREFVVDTAFAKFKEIVVNKVDSAYSRFESTHTAMSAWTAVLDSYSSTNHVIKYPFYPLDSAVNQLYTWDSASTNLVSWTLTSTIPGAETGRFYTLNDKEGIAYLNTAISTYGTAYLGYKAIPAVIYYLDNEHTFYSAQEEVIGRIVDDPKHSSYYFVLDHSLSKELELSLDIPDATKDGSVWRSIYYNQPWKQINLTLKNKITLDPIPSQKLTITLLNSVGKLQNQTVYTDVDGKAKCYYKPATYSEAFIPVTTSNSTTLVNSRLQYLDTNLSKVYLYGVWKDDPLVGSTSTTTDEHSKAWSTSLLNGRKVIFYHWNTAIYNPVTNTQGAFSPVRPAALASTSLTYDTAVPLYSATDTTIAVGALSLIGDLKANLRIEYFDQTANYTLVNQLSREQRGQAEYLSKDYGFGFRVYSSNLSVADTFDAATYLTINPFNSKYTILFEGGYYKDISNNVDFSYTLV